MLSLVRRASDGAILAEGVAVREGILEYPQSDGSVRRELVTLDAVLDTARSVARAPLTLDHPAEGFVTLDTAEKLITGDVDGEVEVEEESAQGGFARVKIAIRRKDAVEAFEAGVRQLSPGYTVKVDETPGEHPVFGKYDARQVGREVNHLAQVEQGRGDRVFIRSDSADAVGRWANTPAGTPRTDRGTSMKPLLITLLTGIGVRNFDSEDAAIQSGISLAAKLRSDMEEIEEKVDELELEKKAADEEIEAKTGDEDEEVDADEPDLKAQLEEALGKIAALEAELAKKADMEMEEKADAALKSLKLVADGINVKHDGLSLVELRVAVAKTRVDSVDAETPAARLDGILSVIESDVAKRSDASTRWDFKPARNDADDSNRADADADAEFYNPTLARADSARVGGDK